jgi:hypothetical protein
MAIVMAICKSGGGRLSVERGAGISGASALARVPQLGTHLRLRERLIQASAVLQIPQTMHHKQFVLLGVSITHAPDHATKTNPSH